LPNIIRMIKLRKVGWAEQCSIHGHVHNFGQKM
jgi:hypothetical protein